MLFHLKKLRSTIRICGILLLARTFGKYKGSGWNGEFDYVKYEWRGKIWVFPKSSTDLEV